MKPCNTTCPEIEAYILLLNALPSITPKFSCLEKSYGFNIDFRLLCIIFGLFPDFMR